MSVFTKVYKLWGRGGYEKNNNGEYVFKQHRIKSSFNNSVTYDFSQSGDNRIITIYKKFQLKVSICINNCGIT